MSGKSNPDPDYKNLTDEELIKKFQNGDIDAYNEIVFRFKDKLVNFLYRYTGSREESEDIAQDTFLKIYTSKHLYREIGKFSTWMYTIAINFARTKIRKKKKYNSFSLSRFGEEDEKDYDLPSDVIAPDDSVNAGTESYYIQKAIDALSDKLRQVIILRDIQDLDYDEIATITDLPLGTVKSRINRGRECLKEMLEHIYRSDKK
ncbi:MAG TPA: sigma-70 family RNA polymerase sigma factor [Ignavibacteria bacterium]|nr:sigma-70 family RNA polymerase sigma factor [Ignavibacteria bacterium]HMR41150.1 sigma-70 family RNA polymerase sigma factor [Ignavibacteria bacterium]